MRDARAVEAKLVGERPEIAVQRGRELSLPERHAIAEEQVRRASDRGTVDVAVRGLASLRLAPEHSPVGAALEPDLGLVEDARAGSASLEGAPRREERLREVDVLDGRSAADPDSPVRGSRAVPGPPYRWRRAPVLTLCSPPFVTLRLIALRAYYFVSFTALGAYLPYMPSWLRARGIEGIAMGAVMAAVPAMSLVSPPVFGAVADALGLRGWLLRVACGGAGVGFAVIALVSATGEELGFAVLFPVLLATAFFRAPMIPLADVIAMEEAKTGSSSYPRIRLWGSIGFLLTSIVVGRFLDLKRAALLPAVIAAALFAAMLAAFRLPARTAAPPMPSAGHARELVRSADFRIFLAAALLAQGAHSCLDLCYSLHLRDRGGSGASVGFAWALGVLSEVAIMAFSAPLFSRFRASHLIVAAYAGASMRWLLIGLATSEVALIASQPMHAISFALMWISSLAYIRDRAPPQSLATAQGLFAASTAAGAVVGMLTWGPLYRQVGGGTTFLIASVVSACAGLLAMGLSRRSSRQA